MKISVIIPVYNLEKYIKKCLESVVNQTYRQLEIIIIDDGSTDASSVIVDEYSRFDDRIKVVHTKNKGVSSARNIALDMIEKVAEFNYILFLDSDDRWVPQCLEKVKTHVLSRSDPVLIFGVQNFDKEGIHAIKHKKRHDPLFFEGKQALDFAFDNFNLKYSVSPASTLFIGNVVVPCRKTRGLRFDTELKTGEDQKYKMEALLKSGCLIVISDLLLQYRLRKGSLSHSEKYYTINERLYVSLTELLSDVSIEAVRALERRLAEAWWNGLRYSAQKGKLGEHWADFSYSLSFMKARFCTNIMRSNKFRKRIIIFNLGKFFTQIYFGLNRKNSNYINTDAYFD